MRVLRRNSSGDDVLAWEYFLRGQGFYWVEVDGHFDDETDAATKEFQRQHDLDIDGEVGRQTLGVALGLGHTYGLVDESKDKRSPNWPTPPSHLHTLGSAERDAKFGPLTYRPAPTVSNPEAIEITNDWVSKNLITVTVPQIARIPGVQTASRAVGSGPKDGKVAIHEKAAHAFIALWEEWERKALLDRVLTWAGSWSPRFIRGSRTVLSNHAYGTAFDINVPWNGLGVEPARVGVRGSVRELVLIAASLGWYWGGWFARRDGMHFEFVGE